MGTWNLYYVNSNDLDLYQLSYNNSKWSNEDLTVLAKAAQPSGAVTSFVIPGTKKIRIYFEGWTGLQMPRIPTCLQQRHKVGCHRLNQEIQRAIARSNQRNDGVCDYPQR